MGPDRLARVGVRQSIQELAVHAVKRTAGLVAAAHPPALHLVGSKMEKESTMTYLSGVGTLGVVSDTHGNILNTQRAARLLESFEVDAVLHCGDIGSTDIPVLFGAWPAHYVLGNVDWQGGGLLAAIDEAGGVFHGRFGALAAAGRKIAFLHGDDLPRFDAEIASGSWDLICHGHTHKANQYTHGKTLVLNPGALQRAWPPSIAVVHLADMQVTMLPLE